MDEFEGLYLSEDELQGITRKNRTSKQANWLHQNGFEFMKRGDGSILLSRRHYELVMGGIFDQMFIGYPEPED